MDISDDYNDRGHAFCSLMGSSKVSLYRNRSCPLSIKIVRIYVQLLCGQKGPQNGVVDVNVKPKCKWFFIFLFFSTIFFSCVFHSSNSFSLLSLIDGLFAMNWLFPQLKYYRQTANLLVSRSLPLSSPLFIFLSRKHYWDLKKWLLEILWNSYENLTYQFEGKRFSKTRHFWESRIITPNSNFWDLGHSVMFKRYRQKGHFCSHIYVLCTKKSTKSTSAVNNNKPW